MGNCSDLVWNFGWIGRYLEQSDIIKCNLISNFLEYMVQCKCSKEVLVW